MSRTVKEMLAEANSVVPKVTPAEAMSLIAEGNVLIVDVRDAPELASTGKIKGAIHVSRGMLEFRADADTPYYDPQFSKDKTILLYCASGGRAALSGKALLDLGYTEVKNVGGFQDWVQAGGEIEHPIEPGMK